MNIKTTKLARSVGDPASLESLFKESGVDVFEADDVDEQSGKDAIARLSMVSNILNTSIYQQNKLGVTIN